MTDLEREAADLTETNRSRWQPYPEYKDSEVEWLGEIPAHWEIWKLSHAFQLIGSGTTPNTNERDYFDGEIAWVTTSELRENIITSTNTKLTHMALSDHPTLRLYPVGTLLIAMYGATIGRLAILGIEACTNQACCALSKPTALDTKFTSYWLLFRRDNLVQLSSGGGQPNINQEKIRSLRVAAPSLREQHAIAAFLDRETAKIDALIAKKRELIALLQEKRSAIISHAVTKGLNPDAPMKDSGIEWLGQIPAHWEQTRIKFISTLKGRLGWQNLRADEYTDDGPYVVSSEQFSNNQIQWEKCPHVTLERYLLDSNIQLAPNDVLLMKDGAAMGKLAYVDNLPDLACLNSHLLLFRPRHKRYVPRFMFFLLASKSFQHYIKIYGTGSTFLGISQRNIGNFELFCSAAGILDNPIVEYDNARETRRDGKTTHIHPRLQIGGSSRHGAGREDDCPNLSGTGHHGILAV